MKCIECKCRQIGWDKNNPLDSWCIGVKHPFKIENIYTECSEYFDGDQYTIPTWGSLEFKADDYTPPTLTVLVGLPGAGKSTFAKQVVEDNPRTVWLSSDQIREKLYGDANCQQDHAKVFSIMQEEALFLLDKGFDVIYDATSITRKARAAILDRVPKHVKKKCVIVWAPVDVCIARDEDRDRTVGPAVIDKMLRRFEAPFYDEGFDKIKVYLSEVYMNRDQYYTELISAMNIDHDNPHHSANVLEHCHLCGTGLLGEQVPDVVITAGFLHDIGKPYTKTFKTRKGEDCDIAHYYDHQAVGAYLSYGIKGHNPTLAWLISTHMAPFINQKYYNSLPSCYKKWIDALHEADRSAH
jgi:predicted kinase